MRVAPEQRSKLTTGLIVVLNGTSSSGKTTIARTLQRLAPEPWLHLGIDALVDAVDRRWLENAVEWDHEPPLVLPLARRVGAAVRAAVAGFARSGLNVVSDDLFLDASWRVGWQQGYTSCRAFLLP